MINLNKNTEAIFSERHQNTEKERYCQKYKTIITKFGILSSRVLLISNILMEEERKRNAGKKTIELLGRKPAQILPIFLVR